MHDSDFTEGVCKIHQAHRQYQISTIRGASTPEFKKGDRVEFIAHIKDKKIQTLEDHLRGTAELCAKFTSEFQNEDWGRVIGLLHDIGKFNPKFQEYIRACNDWNEPESEGQKVKKGPDHSTAGAILSMERHIKLGKIALCQQRCRLC